MMTTLYEVIEMCKKVIPMYEEISEDAGQDGDFELSDYYSDKAKQFKKMLDKMGKELKTNEVLPVQSIVNWLNEEENKYVKEEIFDAFKMIMDKNKFKIEALEKDIFFCKSFL